MRSDINLHYRCTNRRATLRWPKPIVDLCDYFLLVMRLFSLSLAWLTTCLYTSLWLVININSVHFVRVCIAFCCCCCFNFFVRSIVYTIYYCLTTSIWPAVQNNDNDQIVQHLHTHKNAHSSHRNTFFKRRATKHNSKNDGAKAISQRYQQTASRANKWCKNDNSNGQKREKNGKAIQQRCEL